MSQLENTLNNKKVSYEPLFNVAILLSIIGLIDASYLTLKYYEGNISCSIAGCEEVLTSHFATILGIPVAIFGLAFYLSVLTLLATYLIFKNIKVLKITASLSGLGFIFSLYLTYLEKFVIKSLCQYCLLSALITTLIFILSLILIKKNK